MALSNIPKIDQSLGYGWLSGMLLETFCHDGDAGSPYIVWLVVGCISFTGVFFMIVLRSCLEITADNKEDTKES